MNNKAYKFLMEESFNVKPKQIVRPFDKEFCKHCGHRQKDNYCNSMDTACDKIYICRADSDMRKFRK